MAKANLERTRLIAPFDGVIAEITGELNEYVTPSPPGIATPPAVELIDNTCFYVVAPIDEVDAPAVAVDMPARVSLDAFGDRSFEGRVRRVADYVLDIEKQARTVDVEVEFTNPEDIKQLLAGYSADVEVILDLRQDTLRIPTQAVLDGKRVFVYLPDDKLLEERTFKSGISNWDYTEVVTGLQAGELVVIIPVASAQALFNTSSLFRILVQASSREVMPKTKQAILSVIRERHDGEDDVTVITQDALLSTFDRIFTALTLTVAGIAAISLSVAGILIMNVMLIAVSQRTTEIGLLKALGAPRRQIMRLFLAESAILPARRAAGLNPVEALRAE